MLGCLLFVWGVLSVQGTITRGPPECMYVMCADEGSALEHTPRQETNTSGHLRLWSMFVPLDHAPVRAG